MPIFANNDAVQCIAQFLGVGVILLFTLGGWIISQIGQAAKKQGRAMPQRPAGPPRPPQPGARDMSDFLEQAARKEEASRRPGVEILHSPYDDPYVMEAEVVEGAELGHSLQPAITPHGLGGRESERGFAHDEHAAAENVHEQFDYSVGTLGDSPEFVHKESMPSNRPPKDVTAAEIAAVFRSPRRIREAIILKEILTRPDF